MDKRLPRGLVQNDNAGLGSSRSSLVAVILCALIVASLGTAVPIYSGATGNTETGIPFGTANLFVRAGASGSPTGGMADGGLPWRDCARLEAVVAAVGVNTGCRSGLSDASLPTCRSVANIAHSQESLCATSCGVSSSLGRQFTLVGAKPSGTS